jgi:hypothetical protein
MKNAAGLESNVVTPAAAPGPLSGLPLLSILSAAAALVGRVVKWLGRKQCTPTARPARPGRRTSRTPAKPASSNRSRSHLEAISKSSRIHLEDAPGKAPRRLPAQTLSADVATAKWRQPGQAIHNVAPVFGLPHIGPVGDPRAKPSRQRRKRRVRGSIGPGMCRHRAPLSFCVRCRPSHGPWEQMQRSRNGGAAHPGMGGKPRLAGNIGQGGIGIRDPAGGAALSPPKGRSIEADRTAVFGMNAAHFPFHRDARFS